MRANHKIKRRLDVANVSSHFVWQVASGGWQVTKVADGKWQVACVFTLMYINICFGKWQCAWFNLVHFKFHYTSTWFNLQVANDKWQTSSGKWRGANVSPWFVLQVTDGKWKIASVYTHKCTNICFGKWQCSWFNLVHFKFHFIPTWLNLQVENGKRKIACMCTRVCINISRASVSPWFVLQVADGKWQIACMYTRMYINICLYVKYMHVSGHAPITNIGRATPPHHHHHPRLSVLVCTHVCKYAMYTHTKVSKSSTSNGRTHPPPATTPGIQHHEVCTK